MELGEGRIVLFHPYLPPESISEATLSMESRWIGQGPKTQEFEKAFSRRFCSNRAVVAVGAGTDALHLAYIMAGITEKDEVITPVFTCAATNIPLLYQRATIRFADIQQNSLNIDPDSVASLLSDRTKAIVCVHYGGLPCDLDELRALAQQADVPLIEDAAQALGAEYRGLSIGAISEYTAFSFQAVKHITTGDGGMLSLADKNKAAKARRLRWFGIDREAKQKGTWKNDIKDLGFKYQMTDVAASLGLGSLATFNSTLSHRQLLLNLYSQRFADIPDVTLIGAGYQDRKHAAWLCTIRIPNRNKLVDKLRSHGIESGQVHFRNDRYTIFQSVKKFPCPNMDAVDGEYLVLPLHSLMGPDDVHRICNLLEDGW